MKIPDKLSNILELAHDQIGVTETGVNYVVYNDWFWGEGVGGADYPWCCAFTTWLAEMCDVPMPHTAYCGDVQNFAKSLNRWVTSDYEIGDFVIFGNNSHTGLVVDLGNYTDVVTIEGNTGDAVKKLTRNPYNSSFPIIGAYRPDYGECTTDTSSNGDEESASDGDATPLANRMPSPKFGEISKVVGRLQFLLDDNGFTPGNSRKRDSTWDCEFGNGLRTALIQFQGNDTITDETWIKLIGGCG